jgi:hypothetical protein
MWGAAVIFFWSGELVFPLVGTPRNGN